MQRFQFRLWLWLGILTSVMTSEVQAQSLAIKNFREIFESLAFSTGVTPQTKHLATYAAVRDVLPKLGDIDEYGAPVSMAVAKLAGVFCASLIDNDAALPAASRIAHKNVDFSKGPKNNEETIRKEVIQAYAGRFWQMSASAEETSVVLDLMERYGSKAAATAESTRLMFLSGCVAMVNSLGFLMI